jgi:hypothetical protein
MELHEFQFSRNIWAIKSRRMDRRVYSIHERDDKFLQNFGRKAKGRNLGELEVDERTIY